MTIKLGKDAVLYFGTAGTAAYSAATPTKADGISDATLNLSMSEAKVATRGNGGVEGILPVLLSVEVTFKIPLDTSDAFYQAVGTAFTGRTQIALTPLTGPKAVAGNEGPDGDFSVVKFDRAEPIDGEQSMDVTCKVFVYRGWVKTTTP